MYNSWVLVAVRGLSDGMLVMVGGKAFNVYLKSETGGFVWLLMGKHMYLLKSTINQNCCQYGREISSLHGGSGAHVTANSAFCEIEVMKMFMPMVPEPGCINFKKSEGSVWNLGI